MQTYADYDLIKTNILCMYSLIYLHLVHMLLILLKERTAEKLLVIATFEGRFLTDTEVRN